MPFKNYMKSKQILIRSIGLAAYALNAIRKIVRFPGWIIFRIENSGIRFPKSEVINPNCPPLNNILRDKETDIIEILLKARGGKFLEIGIGASPHVERLRILAENGVEYTACDFQNVCDLHKCILEKSDFVGKARFLGNRVGNYVWTLFEMQQRGEVFDTVYLDGHHTFYVDLPAIMIAHRLLKPGGYLLVDDVDWSLQTLRSNMFARYREWLFYRKLYDFREYSPEQQVLKHMKLIVDQVAIKELGCEIDQEFSSSNLCVLKKRAQINL